MIQNTNKTGMVKNGDIVFTSVDVFSKSHNITNKNL